MVGQRGHDTVLGTAGTSGAGAGPVTAEPGAVRGAAPQPAPARPRRPRPWALRAPRRMASQVLLVQLVIAVGVTALATGLFLAPLSDQLDDQATHRALAVAQAMASDEDLAGDLLRAEPVRGNPVQRSAERVRRATGAEYVVVLDRQGVRYSHTDPALIGRRVSTDPSRALAGHEVREIDVGTLGRSARGKTPLRDADGRVIGAVSAGIRYESVRDRLTGAVPQVAGYATGALGVGVLGALAFSRVVYRRTRGLTFSDIAALLDEREAMLHSIREGVLALDGQGRVRLVNDEAQRLLGLGRPRAGEPDGIGRPVAALLGPGRLTSVLTGEVAGTDLLAVRGGRVLVVNRMPTEDGGAVATLRDRTELEALGRELDATRALLDALRAQDHEHANRLHTLLGLLELGLYEEAVDFVTETVGSHRATAEQIAESVGDPLLAALLVGKATVAAERGVALRLAPGSRLLGRLVAPHDLVTVLGNLVDNALEAVGAPGPSVPAGGEDRLVEVGLRARGRTAELTVRDTGAGVPPTQRELVFADGFSTKESAPGRGGRGLGLALVKRHAQRYGGTVSVAGAEGGGAVFTVVLPEALAAPEGSASDPHEEEGR
ncbi:sensor histidine kinase [Streptomyces albidoflavus]|uniref:ATP-binding protein n=1 Tax=Streptomyces albidoflavus TaxID=1886 RepID=UPI00225A5077|nr:sensor histidine kinase [Streptomyces albidoflavus]MCX4443102.1 sensor histidine kinase [Streptomyces albidoflavus]WSD39586.1 sensor histidine kinase [Streptomyces albidoflavus]WTB75144.1 sensor histidine kinase [Streptomyces albidoflavus]WTD99128.1 sensor histidine kinase [Streptomyces albidoflavus]